MSKSKGKSKRARQPEAILRNENTELLPLTRQKVDTLRERLKREKLTPWYCFNSRGVKVTGFDGKTILMSGDYGPCERAFWGFIEPFLKDAIVRILDETLETCRVRGLKPVEPYIRETAALLDGHLIDPIYRYMATIDQRIRGRGNPRSVKQREDVIDRITDMVKFLDKCKDEMIQGIRAREGPEGEVVKEQKKGWKPPRGYKGSKTVGVPRSTLEGWAQRHPPNEDVVKDPQTQECYYPNKWLEERLKNYKPKRKT